MGCGQPRAADRGTCFGHRLTCVSDGTLPNALMALSTFCTTAGISTALKSLEATGYRGAASSSGPELPEAGPVKMSGAGPASAWPSSLSEDGDMTMSLSYYKRHMNDTARKALMSRFLSGVANVMLSVWRFAEVFVRDRKARLSPHVCEDGSQSNESAVKITPTAQLESYTG